MTSIVADADGLIKPGKAGALRQLLSVAEVLVSAVVYEKAAVAGKKEMHEDAFELEKTLCDGGAEVVSESGTVASEAEELLGDASALGAGERAALRVTWSPETLYHHVLLATIRIDISQECRGREP